MKFYKPHYRRVSLLVRLKSAIFIPDPNVQLFYDMNTLVDAGTEGLRLIKTPQQARPHSNITPGLPKNNNTGITVHGYIAVLWLGK